MKESRSQFIARRTDYHASIIREKHPDIPDRALYYWAKDAAEKEWRTGRVYADPVQVEHAKISVYNPAEKFGSGYADGLNLRFNPGGPMVSIISLSYAEGRELALALIIALQDSGNWDTDAAAEAGVAVTDVNEPDPDYS